MKILLIAVLASAFAVPAAETETQMNVALQNFWDFAERNSLTFQLGRGDDAAPPWKAMLQSERAVWTEDNFPDATSLVAEIEKDYGKYPNGHVGHGKFKRKPQPLKPGEHGA